MRLLLDSHTALWWLNDSPRLSPTARAAIREIDNAAYISAVTFWELAIKVSIGKLHLPRRWIDRLRERMTEDAVAYLPIEPAHCEAIQALSFHHRDPFDRMLAAQSQYEALRLVSRDVVFDQYGVERLW